MWCIKSIRIHVIVVYLFLENRKYTWKILGKRVKSPGLHFGKTTKTAAWKMNWKVPTMGKGWDNEETFYLVEIHAEIMVVGGKNLWKLFEDKVGSVQRSLKNIVEGTWDGPVVKITCSCRGSMVHCYWIALKHEYIMIVLWVRYPYFLFLPTRKVMQELTSLFIVTEVHSEDGSWAHITWLLCFENPFSKWQSWITRDAESWRQGERPLLWKKNWKQSH